MTKIWNPRHCGGMNAGYLRETEVKNDHGDMIALQKKRTARYADRRNPYCRTKPCNWTDGQVEVSHRLGRPAEGLIAYVEHLVQRFFVTACLHQGIFMCCAITERD
jgi:hypothetical protein